MSATISRRIGSAMAEGVNRYNNDPVRLREIIAEQAQTIKQLQALIQTQHTAIIEPVDAEWEQLGFRHYRLKSNGREAGTQKALGLRLGYSADRVCKWVRAGRLVTVKTPDGEESVWLDQAKPASKKSGRKVR